MNKQPHRIWVFMLLPARRREVKLSYYGIQAIKCNINVNKRIAALNILSNRNTDYEINLLKGNLAEELLCFMGYYVLLAKAKQGEFTDAVDIIKKYWGGMLKMGVTKIFLWHVTEYFFVNQKYFTSTNFFALNIPLIPNFIIKPIG